MEQLPLQLHQLPMVDNRNNNNEPSLGYTNVVVPQVSAPLPRAIKEDIDTITTIQGFDGAITGIGVTGGGGHPTALKFN